MGLYFLLDAMKNIRPQQQFMFSFCFICRLHLFLLAFASFFLFHSLTYGTELKQEKRVLILFTNPSDLPAYPFVERVIKSSLIEVLVGWLRRPGLAEPFLGDRLGQSRGEREGRY